MRISDKVLDAVYDITVAYPKNIIQGEKDMLLKGAPEAIYFMIKRYPVSQLPSERSELESWLNSRWAHKESQLEEFYETKSFPSGVHMRELNAIPFLYLSCIGWCTAVIFWLWLLWRYFFVDVYFLVAAAVYTLITYKYKGVDRLELSLFKIFEKLENQHRSTR